MQPGIALHRPHCVGANDAPETTFCPLRLLAAKEQRRQVESGFLEAS